MFVKISLPRNFNCFQFCLFVCLVLYLWYPQYYLCRPLPSSRGPAGKVSKGDVLGFAVVAADIAALRVDGDGWVQRARLRLSGQEAEGDREGPGTVQPSRTCSK